MGERTTTLFCAQERSGTGTEVWHTSRHVCRHALKTSTGVCEHKFMHSCRLPPGQGGGVGGGGGGGGAHGQLAAVAMMYFLVLSVSNFAKTSEIDGSGGAAGPVVLSLSFSACHAIAGSALMAWCRLKAV